METEVTMMGRKNIETINNKGSREKIREERERKRQRSFGNSILVLPMVCKPVVCPL